MKKRKMKMVINFPLVLAGSLRGLEWVEGYGGGVGVAVAAAAAAVADLLWV